MFRRFATGLVAPLVVLTVLCAAPATATAQITPTQTQLDPPTLPVLKQLDAFLDWHPATDDALIANVTAFDSPQWLTRHPLAAAFVAAHPEVRDALHQRPDFVMWREQQRQQMLPDVRRDLAALEALCEKTPALDRKLAENPRFFDDPAAEVMVPELKTLRKKRPYLTAETITAPYAALSHDVSR
ncbi:MAG: hypothetical protein K2R93_20470 [Gemmatimonadaceae bacterium]|nr:hypothetical protein [Gemmatimonadaceae bacterium]